MRIVRQSPPLGKTLNMFPNQVLTDSISLFKISPQILLLFNLMTQIIVPIGLWVSLTSFLTRKKTHKIIRICLRHVNVKWRIQNLQTISKLSKCWNSPSLNSHLKKISRNKKSEQCSYICFLRWMNSYVVCSLPNLVNTWSVNSICSCPVWNFLIAHKPDYSSTTNHVTIMSYRLPLC